MDIIQAHAVNNLCYIRGRKMTPKGIVVHSTGANNPNLKRYVDCEEEVGKNIHGNHWNTPTPENHKVCVHAFIGYDKTKNVRVAEILPLDICCWGVGSGSKGSYNYNPPHIQFEICEDGRADEEYYRKAFGLAVEYCAYLCRKFGLTEKQIVSHKEAHALGYGCNHADPDHWMKNFGENMDDFRRRVATLLENSLEKSKEPYLVKITANALNIRKGAGTNTKIVGCIKDHGVYTIVDEKTGPGASRWGKLKSGAGWISLDYVRKL